MFQIKPASILILFFILIFFRSLASGNQPSNFQQDIKSPDVNFVTTFYAETGTDDLLYLFYRVNFKNKPVVEKSELDLVLDNHVSELAMAIKPDADDHFLGNMDFVSQKDT